MQAPSTTHFTRYPIIVLYGVQGLGKSTAASEMPSPVFIQTTDGLEGLGVQAFPLCQQAQDVRDCLRWLLDEDHKYKTVVVDTLGWMEKLVHAEVCAEMGFKIMTQASMKTYPAAKQKLYEMLQTLHDLNVKKKMMVCLIGHASVERFEDPTTASYDRYQLDMNDKVAAMFLQDADIVAFMNQKVMVKEEKDGFSKTTKASGSSRWLYFDPRPGFYAKDHGYGLPNEMLAEEGKTWAAMWEHMKAKFKKPAKMETPKAEPVVAEDDIPEKFTQPIGE